jgi:hypothetical protein
LEKQARALRAERRDLIGWRYIPILVLYCTLCSMFIVYLAWASGPEPAWMFAGFAGGASLLLLYIATDTVSANRLESAAIAESGTSSEVRKLHGKGWRVVDNLPFDKFDVDHIAIGPGGVVVLETKWTSDGLTDVKGRLNQYGEKAIRQVADNVPRINALLAQSRCDARVAGACVVSWGTRSLGTPLTSVGGVTVIDGDQLGAVLSGLDPVMSTAEIDTAFEALNRYLALRLEHIAKQGVTKKAGSPKISQPSGGR